MAKKETKKEIEIDLDSDSETKEILKEILEKEIGDFVPQKNAKWDSEIKEESLKNALKVGIIYPKFKAYRNTVYTIKLLEKPKAVISDKGNFHSILVMKDNMKFSLNMNNSFKFQLKLLLKRNNTDLETLINKGVPLHISQDSIGYWSIQLL